jgi:hypothetical protein
MVAGPRYITSVRTTQRTPLLIVLLLLHDLAVALTALITQLPTALLFRARRDHYLATAVVYRAII